MTGRRFRSLLAANIRLLEDVAHDITAAASVADRHLVRSSLSILRDAIDDGVDLIRGFYAGPGERPGEPEEWRPQGRRS